MIFTASPAGYALYEFYDGSLLLQSSSSAVYTSSNFLQDSTYNISVVATNYLGCVGTASSALTFYILNQSAVSLQSQPVSGNICSNDTIVLTATPATYLLYTFYNNSSQIQSSVSNTCTITTIVNPLSFTVLAVDPFGCATQISSTLNFNSLPTPDPYLTASDSGICNGTSSTLSAVIQGNFPGATYVWSNGSTSQSITISPNQNSTYYFTSTFNGCTSTKDSILVLVDTTSPHANAGFEQTLCKGDSIQLTGSGGLNFLWSPSSSIHDSTAMNPYAFPDSTVLVQLIVTNAYCKDTATVKLVVDRCLEEIVEPIPQIITPNGDNSNEAWVVPDVDYFTNNQLTIYNRWNNIVFEAAPYLNNWKGVNKNGEALPDGVYYYVLDLKNGNNPYVGFIVINR
jgi:gliding motility-associated-like protein